MFLIIDDSIEKIEWLIERLYMNGIEENEVVVVQDCDEIIRDKINFLDFNIIFLDHDLPLKGAEELFAQKINISKKSIGELIYDLIISKNYDGLILGFSGDPTKQDYIEERYRFGFAQTVNDLENGKFFGKLESQNDSGESFTDL